MTQKFTKRSVLGDAHQFAFIGLGNPGSQYDDTRHNVGFWAVDALASRLSFSDHDYQSKYHGHFIKTNFDFTENKKLGNTPLFLLKPQTFMNLSGKSVQSLMTTFKLKPDELCVIHDDVDLPVGKIRIKKGGGAGGHNGLKSIDQTIGSNYWRIRIGVGHPSQTDQDYRIPTEKYVLQNPTRDEEIKIMKSIESFAKHFETLLLKGHDDLMNKIALETNDKPLKKDKAKETKDIKD